MIRLENISKKYQKNKVLDNISVTIPANSVTGILGPNGAGKSTLIKIITGFEFPDNGSVYIEENKMNDFQERKKFLSYMPEKMTVYPDYFTDEFLSFYHSVTEFKNNELMSLLSLKTIFGKKSSIFPKVGIKD